LNTKVIFTREKKKKKEKKKGRGEKRRLSNFIEDTEKECHTERQMEKETGRWGLSLDIKGGDAFLRDKMRRTVRL